MNIPITENKKLDSCCLTRYCRDPLLAISPARAMVSSLITNIAGQLFEVTDDYPGDNYAGGEEIIEPQVMSLTEALAVFTNDITMPAAIPSECALDEDHVLVYVGEDAGPFANSMELNWLSSTGGCFRLRIADEEYRSNIEIVSPGAVEEIYLDSDLAAVLIRGGGMQTIRYGAPNMGN